MGAARITRVNRDAEYVYTPSANPFPGMPDRQKWHNLGGDCGIDDVVVFSSPFLDSVAENLTVCMHVGR